MCDHCSILNLTEEVGDKMVGYEGSYTLGARAVAISVVDVTPGQFSSLSFGVLSDWSSNKPEVVKHHSYQKIQVLTCVSVIENGKSNTMI